MPGLCGLERNQCGGLIDNLAAKYDVGVLPQSVFQPLSVAWTIQTNFSLGNFSKLVYKHIFDRMFDRYDLNCSGGINPIYHRSKSGCLSATSLASHEHKAIRRVADPLEHEGIQINFFRGRRLIR